VASGSGRRRHTRAATVELVDVAESWARYGDMIDVYEPIGCSGRNLICEKEGDGREINVEGGQRVSGRLDSGVTS
jgi:hypothetical protein